MADEPRIAVTGMGLILPTGIGLPGADAVFAGATAVGYLNGEAAFPSGTGAPAAAFVPPADTLNEDRAAQMAVAAADEAWREAALDRSPLPPDRVAVVISLSKGGVFAMSRWADRLPGTRPRRGAGCRGQGGDAADAMVRSDPSAAGRRVAARFGLEGPVLAPVTACASGATALAWAAALVGRGAADAALVGAAEASLHPLVLGGYRRMGVLAEPDGDPATSVRPFSATRRGFAIGEGAGVLVLESCASAERRGVRPLAVLRGWATGSHAASLTDVEPGGATLARIIRTALRRSGVGPEGVDLVHAHGTATAANDATEARAIRSALGSAADGVSVCSTKGSHGHLLGAAAAVEAVLTVLAIQRSLVPPTVNLTDPDPAIGLDCTPLVARSRPIRWALKMASGFGGQMAAIVLARPDVDG